MTIDREKLIQLLVAKTGYDRERVEAQLSELISRIHEAASEGKSFEIEGFGIFTLQDDELNFEPADELRTEINHKYAGMEPIELIGAYGESEEEVETEPESEREAESDLELEEEGFVAETEAGSEDRIEIETETGTEEETEPETEPESGEKESEEPAADVAEESGEAGAEEDEIWGIDDESSLADEISKARTEKWKKAQQEANQDEREAEPEQPETTEESSASDEDIDEVLKSLQDEPTIGKDEAEEQEEQVEFDDLERMLSEEEQEAGQQDAETEPAGTESGRWEPGSELKTSKPQKKVAKAGPKAKRKQAQKKKDPIGTILTVFLILVIVGVGGWFAYDMGVFSGITALISGGSDQVASTEQPQLQNQDQLPSQTQTQPLPQDQSQQPSPDQNADAAGGPGQQQADVANQQQQQQSGQAAEPETGNAVATDTGTGEPTYGLKGPVNPDANTGYTIVVYSLQNETRARRLQNDLSDEGYRALLTDAVVNGNEYWRVGLGQFATVNDAQAAARSLREPFRNNFFIRRIE